ncbi:ATP-binding protein [Hyphomicrobium sp. D-2]|uniref:ATP-binding protein n=1 Tax=Hyphomicrobium sp. D-2 TaxID=3041621 RepID=UPI002457FF1F|nr:ATP-binding protein [Hyphomicrobium sp. D-2]MDH4982190.1 ATP-binding protein [Hyphomicrobium sp. D-2]
MARKAASPPGQGTLFEDRFLEDYAGQIMRDPVVALVELVANAWDAYATKVDVTWPDDATPFRIEDNGIGMTEAEVDVRWRTFAYDRIKSQGGETVQPPPDLASRKTRRVFGRNGKGRFAGFYFSDPYRVTTWRDGKLVVFEISRGFATGKPFDVKQIGESKETDGHGCIISGVHLKSVLLSDEDVRALLSTRFLMDPEFAVSVNGVRVTFADIPEESLREIPVTIDGLGTAMIRVIDSQKTDRTAKQHGVAWWVNRRLVGDCNWRWIDQEKLLDGRTEEAKRYTFVVEADFLMPAVLPDWTGFKPESGEWQKAKDPLQNTIVDVIRDITTERRAAAKNTVRETHSEEVRKLPPLSRERWNALLDEIVDRCPNISEPQVDQLMGLMANMERAQSQYSLLEKLSGLPPGDIDALNDILAKWTVRTAKVALDEIEGRLRIIEEIRIATANPQIKEVQELQPLFGNALWIFGPEFESIEFTSNETMTTVIQKLFKVDVAASRNRPDFVMTPDSTVGFYAIPAFDPETHNVTGTSRLVVVELKKPGLVLGSDAKQQVWKYVKELISKGLVTDGTLITGFVLGEFVEAAEASEFTERDRQVRIRPLLYSSFLTQAEKRMFNLRKRLQEAPFLRNKGLVEFVVAPPARESVPGLFDVREANTA